MPIDPTFDETDSAPEEPRDEAAPLRTPNPPRPPRPGKRSRGSGRIPMPLPPNRPGAGELEQEDLEDAAPRVNIDDEREEPAIPLMPSRARAPSSRPEESFADLNGDSSDQAPAAPVTPWRSVPALQAEPVEITPPRAALVGFSSRDIDREDEHEATMVGKVPDNLLSLSSSGDENTRAFTAPRELIELAKRKREENRTSKAPALAHVRETERPPAAPPVPVEERELADAPAAPAVQAESAPPPRDEADAALPVARTYSGEMEAVALPSRRTSESDAPEPSGPEIEVAPGSELSDPHVAASAAPPGSVSIPISGPQPSAARASSRPWLLVFALFVLVGVVIARWRDLAGLFR